MQHNAAFHTAKNTIEPLLSCYGQETVHGLMDTSSVGESREGDPDL